MSVLARLGMPAFKAGGVPAIADEDWRLEVAGLCESPAVYTLAQVAAWPQSQVDARLTSVSGFSLRALWQGVSWPDFLAIARPTAQASHATFVSWGGVYQTTVSLADLARPRTLLCLAVEGQALERVYGGPLRMIVPCLYGYKSAKWLAKIVFEDRMRGGYWEDRGYSRSGQIEPGWTFDLNTRQRRPIAGGGEVEEF
ncbi:oxidoreductase molybdopterin binding protein [Desulfarculus baarsii DSM 2075]|uniref:Oxidoreductase molybdopterin binding protein n=1 Tax=Desulfarculus baarsii (strain ATCC 33931 / DSM 2075 / LMG 7858 / VKM B-1802 / 2st14) TaxID=644282 RepID=E1QGR3_DESB2|nr:molybdopterin-dependent oxidoreductase [Desulfarculus baarsii]ADK84756.1 oxidoreductase molybdopterin binding protein [Desulfarculus baarsii DSM 2075]